MQNEDYPSELIEPMARSMYYAICHYHPECTWEKAHPETRGMYMKQARAGFDAIRAHVTLGDRGVSEVSVPIQAGTD